MNAGRQLNIAPFQSDLLDLSRWLAAFMVVMEHLRSLLYVNYGTAGARGAGVKVFYFFSGFGHSAVMVFFVMSGFLVGGKVLERLAQGSFNWQKYGIDRFSRLYAVYLLALLLGGMLDYLGYHHFNQFGLYDQSFPGTIGVVNDNYHDHLTAGFFVRNLVMCQFNPGLAFGSNGPLWSLSNESWYYLAGPLVFSLFFIKGISRRMLALFGLAWIIWFLPASILIYALLWLLGALLYFINSRRLVPLWISLAGLGGALTIARTEWVRNVIVQDFLIGISFALVINSAVGIARRLPANRWSRAAANCSYSVYLCHYPFAVLVVSVLFRLGVVGYPGPASLKLASVYLLVLLAALGWCYLVSLATERQTPRIRGWLNHGFARKPCLPLARPDSTQ